MSNFACVGRTVPIGFYSVTGNICPESGVWSSVHSKTITIIPKGKKMPHLKGIEILWELKSYLD